MKMLLFCFALLCACFSGCSTFRNDFVDKVEGDNQTTEYHSHLMAAPFGKVSGEDAKMNYAWDGKGGGKVSVGSKLAEVDNTPQIQAMQIAIDAAVKAAMAYLTSGGSMLLPGNVASAGASPTATQVALDDLGKRLDPKNGDLAVIKRSDLEQLKTLAHKLKEKDSSSAAGGPSHSVLQPAPKHPAENPTARK